MLWDGTYCSAQTTNEKPIHQPANVQALLQSKRIHAVAVAQADPLLEPIQLNPPGAGVEVNIKGGRHRNGGKVRVNTASDPLAQTPIHWTVRCLDCSLIAFPPYFVGHRTGTQVSAKNRPPDNSDAVNNSPDMNHWYEAFTEVLANDFVPAARGAIGANIRILPGGIGAIAFYGYKYEIPLKRSDSKPQPSVKEPDNSQAKLKESIIRALKQATGDPSVALPSGMESVDVKVLFGGDPEGEGGTWENLGLIDDLNGDILLPHSTSGKSQLRVGCC